MALQTEAGDIIMPIADNSIDVKNVFCVFLFLNE